MQPGPKQHVAPWSTLKTAANDGKVTVVTTTSSILQYVNRNDAKAYSGQ